MVNKGYMTARTDKESDNMYTPYYAVEPLLKYISKDLVIWCPFDKEWSAYYQVFTNNGYKVIRSHICEEQDFFTYEPDEHYDIIISNPPFSLKDRVLERLYQLNKPFAMLLPLPSLQGQTRYPFFKQGIQILAFDKRIEYLSDLDMRHTKKGSPFASVYFCRNLLPNDLIIENLNKYDRSLLLKVVSLNVVSLIY